MTLIDSLVVFAVGLGLGALGIFVGAKIITGVSDYSGAVITALLGAIVWAVVSFLFGFIPLLGPILTYLAWLAVINSRYPGGWFNAALMALIAWGTVLVALYLLSTVGIGSVDAIGIPDV